MNKKVLAGLLVFLSLLIMAMHSRLTMSRPEERAKTELRMNDFPNPGLAVL